VNPFDALGLPARPDLTDEQVRAAWRAIATAAHPDRADGGDVARYTAATSAYVTLRTPWGRSEAYADVAAAADDTSPLPVAAGPDEGSDEVPYEPLVGPGALVAAYTWQLPARIRHGRPVRLLIRGLVAGLLCLGVLAEIPGQPAAPPLMAALIAWFVVTGRSDLAPPRHR
jgi:hypothetical protein